MRLFHFAAFGQLLILLAASTIADSALPPLTKVPLHMCDGVPCFDVELSGKELRLTFGTRTQGISVIDLEAAKSLGIQLEPMTRFGRTIPGVQTLTARGVAIGGVSLGDIKFVANYISEEVSRGTFPHADGTVTYEAFNNRILQLDYGSGAAYISQPLSTVTPCPSYCGDISVMRPSPMELGGVTVTGFNVNGSPIVALVDTSFTGTMLIYPSAVVELGLTTECKGTELKSFPFTLGGKDLIESSAAAEGYGSVTLATKAPLYCGSPQNNMLKADFHAAVGNALLKGHKITFNFHDNKFWVE